MGNSAFNSCKNKDPIAESKDGDNNDQTLEEQRLEAKKRRRAKRKEKEAVANTIQEISKQLKLNTTNQLNSQTSNLTHQADESLPPSFRVPDDIQKMQPTNQQYEYQEESKENSSKYPSCHLQIDDNKENESRVKGNKDGYFSADDIAYYKKKYLNEKKITPPKNKSIRWKQAEVLGSGSFGQVTLGWNIDTGELMAVKQVNIGGYNIADKQEKMEQIQSEIEALQTLSNKNIVRYIGTKRSETSINVFLEHVPGGSISQLLYRYGKFNETLIRQFIKQILKGLEYLHAHEIIHRDIKGANVLVDKDGNCKLADFGSAKKIVEEKGNNNSINGTPYWMSPETIKQIGSGRFADIWSIGCTVIEMATAKPPFSDKSQIQAMFQIANAVEPPPIPEDLSPKCRDFISKCLKIQPKERYNVRRLLNHEFINKKKTTNISAKNLAQITEETTIDNQTSYYPNRQKEFQKVGSQGTTPFQEDYQTEKSRLGQSGISKTIFSREGDSIIFQQLKFNNLGIDGGKSVLSRSQVTATVKQENGETHEKFSRVNSVCVDQSNSESSLNSSSSSSSLSSISNERRISRGKNEFNPREAEVLEEDPISTSHPVDILRKQKHDSTAVLKQNQQTQVYEYENRSVVLESAFQENLVTEPGLLLSPEADLTTSVLRN